MSRSTKMIIIGTTGPVTGIAYKDCNWQVPYKVSPENKTRILGFDGGEGISQNLVLKRYESNHFRDQI